MELRLGKNYTPVPLGQLGQTCKPHSTLSLKSIRLKNVTLMSKKYANIKT